MTWFDINRALVSIRQFLSRWRSQISNIHQNIRPSSVFECFCFISVVEAYDQCGYNVQRKGPREIVFKRSVRGWPNIFTYFVVSNAQATLEIRQNQGYRNNQVYFNLDIAIIHGEDALDGNTLTAQSIHTFCECKHYRTFSPSVCASFLGLARLVMPRNILWAPSQHSYPPPVLLVSGSASPNVINQLQALIRRRRYHIRFLENISPYGGTSILTRWILRRI